MEKMIRVRMDSKRELENKSKCEWLKNREHGSMSLTEYRSEVYRVGQAVLENEYKRNMKFWDKHIKTANGE